MHKNVRLPDNYSDLSLSQKEAFWIGMLLIYEDSWHFDDDYWVDEIVNCSEVALYDDDLIALYKCYNAEYKLLFKKTSDSRTGVFGDFFSSDECDDYYCLDSLSDSYKGYSVRDYLREKGFPVDADFWK